MQKCNMKYGKYFKVTVMIFREILLPKSYCCYVHSQITYLNKDTFTLFIQEVIK